MVDVNRIRERAADWLGDVGDAALDFASRVFQWRYFRLTGDVWSISQRTIGLAPSLRWVFTGRGEQRVGPDIGEAFAQGVREAQAAAWNRCAACEQAVDVDDGVDGSEVKCGGCGLWNVVTEYRDGSFGLSPLEEEDAATDPSVEPANGGAGPWHGLDYDVASGEGLGSWVAIARRMASGGAYRLTVTFNGQHAEERAREYAALMSAPTEDAAPSTCDACGKPASTGRCFVCSVALGDSPRRMLGLPDAPAVGKPAFVTKGQLWSCAGVDGSLEVASADGARRAGAVGLAPVGSVDVTVRAREADMLGLKEWRFLG